MKSLILKKLSWLLAFVVVFSAVVNAQSFVFEENAQTDGFKIQSSSKGAIVLTHAIHQFDLRDIQIEGEMMKQLSYGLSFIPSQEGAPDLPGEARYLLIPNGAQVQLKVLHEEKVSYQNIEIAPAAAIPFDTEEALPAVKGTVYQKDTFFPQEVYQSEVTQVRGMTMAIVGFNPFQYNPVTKELVVYKNVEIEVQIIGGNGNYGDDRFRSRYWDQILDDLVYNNQDIPVIDYSKRPENNRDNEGCEYLIIVPNQPDFLSWADSIKVFRTEQGIQTQILTTDDIGGNTVEGIKGFFNDVYETWNPVPAGVLLMADYGNDANTITSKTYPHPYSGSLITDNYYADYTGNDLPDFVFARITGRNYDELQIMVEKFLTYERTPPTNFDFYNKPITALGWQTERWFQICSETVGGYMKNVLGKDPVRINAVYQGNPNSDPWSTATNTTQVINYFGPMGQNYITQTPAETGGFSGGTPNDVVAAINDGAFILQHRDHGMESGWGEPAFTMSYCSQLNNVDELTHIFSINCLTGRFDVSGECFAEKFHRYANGGALSLTAATQVSYSFVNDAYVWGLFDNMWPDYMPDYGGNLIPQRDFLPAFGNASGKYFLAYSNWPYNTGDKQITYRLFHHHGDAFGTIYTEVPEDLEVVYSEVVISGPEFIEVQANEGAVIAFSVDGTLIGVGEGTGSATPIDIIAQDPGTIIKMVITKQNYFRFERYLQVIAPDGPYIVKSGFDVDDASANGNGLLDFGESALLDFSVKNLGTEIASNVQVTISCDDDLITLTDNVEDFGDVGVDEEITHTGAFAFTVAEEIPDNHSFLFSFTATNGVEVWESSFSIKAYAPVLEILNMDIQELEGNGNGRIDAGETAILNIEIENAGRCASPEGLASIISSSDYLTINSDEFTFVTIDSAGMIMAEFNVTAADDTPIGTVIPISTSVVAGPYSHEKDFNFSVGLIVEDWESGTFDQFDWASSGNANWTIDNTVYYEGDNSAKSGDIGDSQSSILSLTYDVMVDDQISFFYRVSSESGYDKLQFKIDGAEQGSWSGEVPWTEATYAVSAGPHVFQWIYYKDTSVSSGSDCAWVDFIILPPMLLPTANAGADAEVCHTQTSYQLSGSVENSENIEWSTSGNGTFNATDIENPIYTFGSEDFNAGMVTLTLTAQGSNGNAVNSMVVYLDSDPIQPEMPQGEAVVCFAAANMMYTVGDESLTYNWFVSPENAAQIEVVGNAAYLTFNEGFTGELSLTAQAFNSCGESPVSEAFVIQVAEQASASFVSDVETCFGSEVALEIELSGEGPWNVQVMDENGDELVFEANDSPYEMLVNPEITTTYSLMQVSDIHECIGLAEGSALVTVFELPTASLTAPSEEVCGGDLVEVSLSLTGTAPWNVILGDGADMEQSFEVADANSVVEFVAPYESMNLQFVSISDANGCNGYGEGNASIQVAATPIVDLGVDTTVCQNHVYTVDAGNDGSTYLWSNGATSKTLEITESMADNSGNAVVSVEVTNPTGCSSSDEMMVHFKDCTGIDEINSADIQLMPNPNNGLFKLEISASKAEIRSLQVINSLGEIVKTIPAGNIQNQMSIDLSNLSDGVYFLIVNTSDSQINKRFVIRK